MAGSTTNISIRMDSDLKAQADALFGELGMNLSLTLSLYSRPHHDVQGERRESPLSAASKSAGFDNVCSPPL